VPREIEIGSANDKFVVIESGLEKSQTVVMNPRRWLNKVQLPEPPEQVISPTEKIAGGEPGVEGAGAYAGGAQAPGGPPGQSPAPGGAGPGGPGGGGPGGAGGGFNPAQVVDRIFSSLDANSDGQISADEIPADRAERMKGNDTDGDGVITRAEMTAAMSQRMAAGGGPGGPGFGGPGGGGPPGGGALPRGE
jgi:hypothetical protein